MKKKPLTPHQKDILKKYVSLVKNVRLSPSRADLHAVGISRDKFRHHFSNIKGIRTAAMEHFPEVFKGVIDVYNYASAKREKDLKKEVKKFKRFFITTAVNKERIHKGFMKSIEGYCKEKNAKLLILPCLDSNSKSEAEVEWHFDDKLLDHPLVFGRLDLNSNIHTSCIKVGAKTVNPVGGLGIYSQGKGTFIFASPKQFLEYDAVANNKMPHARMSPGACTIPNDLNKTNSSKTDFMYNYTHTVGGIIVEIEDNEIFYFRQVQADVNGHFADLGKLYTGRKSKTIIPKLVMGDYHAGEHDETVIGSWEEIIDEFKVDEVIFHDIFNGRSINHHEKDNIILRSRRSQNNHLALDGELREVSVQLDRIMKHKSVKKGVIVRSNHDDFLDRWLQAARFKDDPLNFQIGCKLADKAVDGLDPLQEGIKLIRPLKTNKTMIWLKRDEDYIIAGIECGAHGDKGPNGSRGGKAGLEKAYGKCNIAHSHTPGILRGVFQVGTSTLLRLGYNIGPSSWVHCSLLQYPNGQRQLINSINGKWHLAD